MYLIRDKESGEIWFVGAVYNPLPVSQESKDIPDFYTYQTIIERMKHRVVPGQHDQGHVS